MKKSRASKKVSPAIQVRRALQDGVRMGMRLAARGVTEDQASELLAELDEAPVQTMTNHGRKVVSFPDRKAAIEMPAFVFHGPVTNRHRGEKAMSETPRAQLTQSEQLLDERECAELLGMAFETLQDLRRRGEAPPYARVGKGKIVYLRTRVIEWLDENLVRGKEPESQ